MANKVYDIRIEVEGLQQGERAVNQVRELSEAEKRRKKAFDEANKTMQDSVNKQAGSYSKLANLAKTAGVAIAGMFAIDKIKDFTAEVFKVTATFQKFEAVLTNTLGSRSEAQKALKQINDFAASTPFSVEELTDSFVKLANAGFKPTTEEMTKLGDLASATGKSFDQLTEAILDAQSFEFERLKEFGIKASQNGDKIAFSFKGVTTEVAKTNDAVRAYILSLGNLQGVAGGMAAISKTLEGQISNLGDTFDQLKLAIGDRLAGAFSEAIGMASDLLGALKGLVEVPLEEKIAREQAEFNTLVLALNDTNNSTATRKRLIDELQAKYGEYLGNINLETASQKELEQAMIAVNNQFNKKIFLARKDKERQEIAEGVVDLQEKEFELVKQLTELKKVGVVIDKRGNDITKETFGLLETRLANIRSQIKKAQQEQLDFENQLSKQSQQLFGTDANKQREMQEWQKKFFADTNKLVDAQNAKESELRKKQAEEAKKLAEKAAKEAEKRREEEAKRIAELALREKQAQQDSLVQITQFELQELKTRLDNKKLTDDEKKIVLEQIAQKELELEAYLTNQKLVQYELDKENKIQVKELTATEEENILREQANKEIQIEREKQKKLEEIDEQETEKRKGIAENLGKAVLNISKDLAKGKEEIEKDITKKAKEEQDQRDAIIDKAGQYAQFVSNSLFEFDKINNEKKLQALQAQKDAELKLAGENAQNRAFVEAKFANEEKKLKEGQARADRNKALFDIAIQTAVGIAKAISASPLTFGLPFSAVVAAQGAIQAAVVASRPLPKFKDGVEFLEGPGTGTSDSITARLSRGERVVTAKTNKEYYPTLSAIHNGLISPDAINSFVTGVKVDNGNNSLKSEIKILAKQVEALTRVVENQVKHNINIDANGFSHFVESERERTEILNKRYEFG